MALQSVYTAGPFYNTDKTSPVNQLVGSTLFVTSTSIVIEIYIVTLDYGYLLLYYKIYIVYRDLVVILIGPL